MGRFTEQLQDLRDQNPELKEAVRNVDRDVRSTSNPNGNLSPELCSVLDSACETGQPVRHAIEARLCLRAPQHHRSCTPPETVRRAVPRSDFLRYHLLEGAADLSEMEPWSKRLKSGKHRLQGDDLGGRTGRAEAPCWWTFSESGRTSPNLGRHYAAELALTSHQLRKAERDGVLVEISVLRDRASDHFFKPTALEGFGPETPFRPELSGSDFGRTAPADSTLEGWPEVVSASTSYQDRFLEEDLVELSIVEY